MHECPRCGAVCDCDGEDTWFSFYPECEHDCEVDSLDIDDDSLDEDELEDIRQWEMAQAAMGERKMNIVKQRVGLLSEWCTQCHRTVVISGMMASGGERLICEQCANAGLPGKRGHDLPTFAVEWAEATGTQLDASVCAHEWRAWEIEAEMAERSKQPEVAMLALTRSAWMLQAYQAFMAAEKEL